LTALDQAGNVRTDTAGDWLQPGAGPSITCAAIPEFILAKRLRGAGSLLVSYSVAAPTTADFRNRSAATGAVVRRFTRVHTACRRFELQLGRRTR